MSHILIIDDEESICWALRRLAQEEGHAVSAASSAEEAFELAGQRAVDCILLDIRLPGLDGLAAMARLQQLAAAAPIVVMTAFGSLGTAVEAIRNGAFDYLTKPFDLERASEVLRRALAQRDAGPREAPPATMNPPCSEELLGASPAMQEVFKRIALVAPTNASVLIVGESGTGKELVARAIHRHSQESSGPLVTVNLAALNPALVESELFGHVRGAFTGADAARPGLLELADGGTAFFDEAGDIPLSVQVKLLRALEQREITPVGDAKPRRTAFRVLAATHRDLRQEVQKGAFREDLFFRLAVFEIHLPPLRQRVEDIPLLAERFLQNVLPAGAPAAHLTQAALDDLRRRPWPGNVRELRNAVEHAALLARAGAITPEHLPPQIVVPALGGIDSELSRAVRCWALDRLASTSLPENLYQQFLDEAEPPLLSAVLERTAHNRVAAANLLGIHRATLRKKLN
ncbi:MAG TPA: sigma-54 dependent transcriptional regulator [Pirellulales bacterium]|jgi:two-component system nitrogen regulation response regulator GlnG|nr:sigma-54 dependent transcriptional regulator [Pirellulales bacterium]